MERDPSGVFIPEEVLNEIIWGSHEVTIGMVAEAVQDCAKEKFGAEVARVIATFPSYALVATDRSEFFRVKYGLAKEGVNLSAVESIKLPVVTEESLGDYVNQQARKVVDDLFRVGATEDVCSRLHTLSEAVIGSGKKFTPEALGEAIKSRLSTEPAWWAALQQNEKVLRGLRESVEPFVDPKFRSIIDGTIEEDELDKYRALVDESLRKVAEYVSEMAESAALDLSDAVLKPEFVSDESEAAVEEFGEFVQSYCGDVCGLAEELRDAVRMFDESCLVCSAEIHDQVAKKLPDLQAGAQFIKDFSERFEAKADGDE